MERYVQVEYKKGNLNPKPGEVLQTEKIFTKKFEEMEA